MINVFIIILGTLLLFGVLYYEKKKDRIPLLIMKSILSLLFVMTALLQAHPVPTYYHYLLVGLIFCLMGDVYLALPQKKAFMAGLVAFLVGHVFFISHLNLPLDFNRGVHHSWCECLCFFLASSSFRIYAFPSLIIYLGDHCHGIWSLDGFLEVLFPDFGKDAHLIGISLFLLLRSLCRPEQIHKRGIPKSAPRLAFILRRAIPAGFLYRSFEVTGRRNRKDRDTSLFPSTVVRILF
jgi:hypothetical protein